MNGAILGLNRHQIDARFDQIAAFADIGPFIDQPVKTYSSGMTVRLAFSVIAHVDADLLVIDEALAVGDALFTQKCLRFLRRFQERGAILFVSHDTSAVLSLCQRALWLDQGICLESGPAKTVVEAYMRANLEIARRIDAANEPPVGAPRVTPPVPSVRSSATTPRIQPVDGARAAGAGVVALRPERSVVRRARRHHPGGRARLRGR